MILGVPITGHVSQYENNYYRLVVVEFADLVLSLTPFYGDPDLFVSVAPNLHPNAMNLTWASAAWGADTMTIQANDLAAHCGVTPNATTGDRCVVYLGMYDMILMSFNILSVTKYLSSVSICLSICLSILTSFFLCNTQVCLDFVIHHILLWHIWTLGFQQH